MPYLIGMDEAGYGPNLGPLVVSASVWQMTLRPSWPKLEPWLSIWPSRAAITAPTS